MRSLILPAWAFLLASGTPAGVAAQQLVTYQGPCDASAAVALDGEHFVAANDEDNALRSYRRDHASAIRALDLSAFLGTKGRDEADIEGAAAIGTRVYWITSHGRNSNGKARPSRHRLFATELRAGSPPTLEPVGKPYVDLVRDFADDPLLKAYQLGAAARLAAEAEGGLNIEGLAATPDGRLLIGLRNPLRGERALVIPLENPHEVIEGKRTRLGAPIELDLDRRGIRSLEWVGSSYLVVAGPVAERGSFALYRWSGRAGEPAVLLSGIDLRDVRPEALFAIPATARVQLLSDDGGVRSDAIECKARPMAHQAFRSLIVTP